MCSNYMAGTMENAGWDSGEYYVLRWSTWGVCAIIQNKIKCMYFVGVRKIKKSKE